jgi:hypothetical protein
MAEPDFVMQGPGWPPEWPTAWVTGKWTDIEGNYLTGDVTLTNSVNRAVATASRTAVIGGKIPFPLAFGVPSGPRAQENANGDMCIEFPIGTDPDVVPAEMQMIATENLKGADGNPASNTIIRKVLTTEYTLDNPFSLTSDLTSVAAQAGVVYAGTYFLDNEDTPIPSTARDGEMVLYLDTYTLFRIRNA